MTPKFPLRATDGTTTIDVKLLEAPSASISSSGTVILSSPETLLVSDYDTIQEAFNALEASTTFKTLVFPSDGVYAITSDLTLENCTDKIIEGNGAQITFTSAVTFGIKFWDNTSTVLRNLKLTGPNTGTNYGIHISNASKCRIEHVRAAAWYQGIHYAGSGQCFISECECTANTDSGFLMNGEYGTIDSCIASSNTTNGIKITNGNNKVLNSQVLYNLIGILVDSVAGGNVDHGLVANNSINHNTACGVYLKDLVYSMDVVGNEIWATSPSNLGVAPKNSSFGVYILNGTGVKIADNSISRNEFNIGIEGINKSSIIGNTMLSDTTLVTGTDYQVREVGGTNTSYLIDGNVFENDLLNGHTVVLATDCPNATLGTNIIAS